MTLVEMAWPILSVIAGTLVLEDATTVATGLVVAGGQMSFAVAFIALMVGIASGDYGLYVLGRGAGGSTRARRLVSPARLERATAWFKRHGLMAVVASRFVPGLRVPTYVAAGALRYSPARFVAAILLSGVVWTFMLLTVAVKLGASAGGSSLGPRLAVGAVVAMVALGVAPRLRRRRAVAPTPPTRSPFEFWSPWVFYVPVLGYGLYLALRHRGLMFPTAVNPSIYASGLIMESKSQILSLVPEGQRRWVAPWVVHEVEPASGVNVNAALADLARGGLELPVVVKPDVGQRGAGVRPVRTVDELASYLGTLVRPTRLILQALVDLPHEAGLFYVRHPSQPHGELISLTDKELPALVGDGQHSIAELIERDPRHRLLRGVYVKRHAAHLGRVLQAGERFPLVFAGNHCQGAIFRDGARLVTPALTARIDEIARSMPGFHFGRFDVKYESVEALGRGEGLRIVEINGAGSEVTHIWDPSASLGDAYRALFGQWRLLFEIGKANAARGASTLSLLQLLKDLVRYRGEAQAYPSTV